MFELDSTIKEAIISTLEARGISVEYCDYKDKNGAYLTRGQYLINLGKIEMYNNDDSILVHESIHALSLGNKGIETPKQLIFEEAIAYFSELFINQDCDIQDKIEGFSGAVMHTLLDIFNPDDIKGGLDVIGDMIMDMVKNDLSRVEMKILYYLNILGIPVVNPMPFSGLEPYEFLDIPDDELETLYAKRAKKKRYDKLYMRNKRRG